MYLIELILKKLTYRKEKPSFNPLQEELNPEYETCQHTFMPIDSTNETLSCTKCGTLKKRSELINKNFFAR